MPSPIVVEDGTGIADANSYVSGDDVRAYAAQRGFKLVPAGDDFAGDDLLLPFVVAAMDYLQGMAFVGKPVDTEQPLDWPRNYVRIGCVSYPSTTIPTQLKKAQMQLIVEQLRGNSLDATVARASDAGSGYASPLLDGTEIEGTDGRFIKRERLEGVSDVEYSEAIGTGTTPYLPNVNKLLAGLISGGFSGQMLVSRG